MIVGIAIGTSLLVGVGFLLITRAVADRFDLSLFHVGDAA